MNFVHIGYIRAYKLCMIQKARWGGQMKKPPIPMETGGFYCKG